MRPSHLFLSSTLLAGSAMALPPAPELPAMSSALAKKVQSVERQLVRVSERCQDTGERNPGEYDKRCPNWLAAISRSGDATLWAVARSVLGEGETTVEFGDAQDTLTQVYSMFGGSGSAGGPDLAIRMLLRRLHRTASGVDGDPQITRVLDQLAELTGYDAKAYIPEWYSSHEQAWEVAVAERWLTWYGAHGSKSPVEWRKAGLEQARAWLTSKDALERHTAIRRLLRADGDPAAAREAVVATLSDPDILGERLWDFVALAGKAGVTEATIADAGRARRKVLIARGDESAASEEAAVQRDEQAAALATTCHAALVAERHEDALAACSKAHELDDDHVGALVDLGWAQLELGKTDDALTTAGLATDLLNGYEAEDAQFGAAYTLLAAARTVAGQLDDAGEALDFGADSADKRARRRLLAGKLPSKAWVESIAARYFCWQAKGDSAADAFLSRRGVVRLASVKKALAGISAGRREALMAEAPSVCAAKTQASAPASPDGSDAARW